MSRRLVLFLLTVSLAVMSVAPAASAEREPAAQRQASASSLKGCGTHDTDVSDGTPVHLGSLLGTDDRLAPLRPAALPLSPGRCAGVRPGAMVMSEAGLCSFNYLFSGSDGRSYMGTAGHCILGLVPGEEVWQPGQGPAALDAEGNRVGEFAYAILDGVRDFALVRLDPGVHANPQMCHFGGPTGVNDDLSSGPVVVQHVGQGVLFGQVVPARTGVALNLLDSDQAFITGLAVFGDSGGPVNSADGRALGVLVTVGLHLGGVPNAGLVGVTRLGPQVAQAQELLGTALQLRTAPTL